MNLNLTLDGVMQAPGRADEDTREGFQYGGWATPYFDPVMGQAAAEGMAKMPALLFGRRTYQDFYSVWPKRTDGNPFTDVLNRARSTLRQPRSPSRCPGETRCCSKAMPRRPWPTSRRSRAAIW